MAKTSFTIRKEDTGLAGSYLQYPPTYDSSASSNSYLRLGAAGGYASTPNTAPLNIAGDIECVVRVAVNSTGAFNGILATQTSATSGGYWWYLQSPGNLTFRWSTGAGGELFRSSGNTIWSVGFVAGSIYWLKATLDVDNGASGYNVRFYWAPDSATEPTVWNAFSQPATGVGTTSIGASATQLVIGAQPTLSSALDAHLYRTIIRNGIGGTTVFDIDFVAAITAQNQTVLTASTQQAVTVVSPASVVLGLNSAARTTDDGYLRADGFQTAPLLTLLGEFTATPVDYTLTYLTWGVPLTTTLTATPQATQVILVYSPDGEPDTIDSGAVLVETTTDGEYYHVCPEGRWAYYTLFVKYQSSTGDLYYDAAARLSVLVPKNYGSSTMLFNHIPNFYREQDSQFDTGGGGPLYRYLSIFGWDIDRLRTLIDYFIGCRDPQVARTEELDLIASELGVPFTSVALGTSRLRAYLNEIGSISRGNGTSDTLSAALTALTGSEVVVNYATSTIYVKPQRVNLIQDPMLITGLSTSLDGGLASTTSFGAVVDAGTPTSPMTPTYDGGSPSTSFISGSGYWSSYSDPSQSNVTLLEGASATIKVAAGKVFYFSVDLTAQDLILKVGLYDTVAPSRPYVVTDTTPTIVGGRKYWKLEIPDPYTGVATTALRVEHTTVDGAGPTQLFKNVLLEENNFGTYFDGSTARGGWVTGAGGNVSDFRWLGAANNSFSVYSANFQKTKATLLRLLPQLLPVTQLVSSGTVYSNRDITTKWTITYNYMPDYP